MTPASPARELTRRSAVAGLASALSSPALAGLRSEPDFDVLIVGAGPAGIAAARRIAGTKWKFGIIEASDRRGGRCFTETTTFGLPYDQGACSIHVPPRSSLAGLAARNGIELYPDPEILQIRLRGRKAFDRGLEEVHFQERAGAVLHKSGALLRGNCKRGGRQGRHLVRRRIAGRPR